MAASLGFTSNVYGHSVQVGYCITCNGDLTLYVEHWHGTEDPSTTTMTIDLTISGVTTTVTGSPTGRILNTPLSALPGCANPIHIFASCPGQANTYNDWVLYTFPQLPCGQPVVITIISGNSAFTEDGCGMYPASTPVIIVPCNANPPPVVAASQSVCAGVSASLTATGIVTAFQWQSAPAANGPWTDVPGAVSTPFSTGPMSVETYYRVLEPGACPSNVISVSINPTPASDAGADVTVCAGSPDAAIGTANTAGNTYSWTPITGLSSASVSNPSVTFTSAGVIVYKVTTTAAGCSSIDSTVVTINPLPAAVITGTAGVCKGGLSPDVTFTGSLGTAPYTFTYAINGGANQTITTTSGNSVTVAAPTAAAGTFTYSLVSVLDASSTACSQLQSGSAVITIYALPAVAFSSTKVCYNNPTVFSDSTTTSSGTLSSWSWNFGDGSSLNSSENPSYVYGSGGVYTVKLIVNSSFGCTDSISKTAQVYYNPTAGFTHADVCFRDSMHFVNTSTINTAASIASYLWVFGDSSPTSILKNPAHYYSSPGSYNVTLITASADGCSSVINVVVNVYAAPVSAFTFTNICKIDSAHFLNASLNPAAATIANWSWSFGDGTPVNTAVWSPPHLYIAPGDYTVTLITHSSNLGCPDTLKDTITVFPMPAANFGFRNVCLNQAMNFHDSTIVSSGSIAAWSWNFGGGAALNTAQSPSYMYPAYNTYSVNLIVTTNNGCKDTVVKSVKVHPLPNVLFTAPDVCDGTAVTFTNFSVIPVTDTLHSYSWNFGDNSPLNVNQNTSHLYAAAGSYPVKLTAVSNFGCVDSITKIRFVNPNPVVKFTAADTIGCAPLCTSFQDLSIIGSGANVSWQWNLGDGSAVNTSHNPNHCYINDSVFAPNVFNVILTVTSDSGCVSVKTKNNFITVYPNPKAVFTASPETETIVNPIISFNDLSTGANFWHWDFADSVTSSIQSPMPHTYKDTGTYKIMLVTSTLFGCIDTAYQTVIIEPDFLFYIPNVFTPNDDGINDSFSGKGIFFTEYQMMIFDRWGNLIFFTDDINKPWDGKANYGNDIAQQDVYIYTIKLTDIHKQKHSYKGLVTLVR